MKFFCLQPDIVEDVPSVRYKTKSTNHNAKTGNSGGGGNHGITGLFLPMTTKHSAPSTTTTTNNGTMMTMMGATNRSRTSVSVPAHGGPKSVGPSVSVGARKHSSIGGTGIGQAFAPATAPIHHPPVSAPPATVYLGPSHTTTTTATANVGRGQAITNDPKAYGHHVTSAIPATMMVDSDRELSGPSALRRKSRRMSAPLVSLGLSAEKNSNNVGMESGNESSREKKIRRVSKLVIGNPEGFRHEAHVGVGDAFAMGYGMTRGGGGAIAVADTTHVHEDATRQARAPSVHESWNVEAWRADIERTRKPNGSSSDGNVANPQPAARPKGPRPTSVTPSSAAAAISVSASVDPRKNSTRARKRSSVDSGLPRPSFERPSFERDPERERDSEREGASTEPPTSSRPGVLLPAGRTSPTGASVGYSQRSRSRSRSGSDSFGHVTRPVIIHQQQQQQPPPSSSPPSSSPPSSAHQRYQTASQTHIPGQDSITSLASTTFSNPTSQSSHATTATSLTRSHSDKPYFHHQHHHHHQHQSPLQQYYQQQQQRQQHHPQSSSYSGHESGGGRFWDPNGAGQDGGPIAAATVSGSTSASLLQRSVSANAAIRPTLAPSSTSSTATAASVASSSVTLTMGSNTVGVGGAASRKPIPIPRRKPVPQHLPATVEVSPFPSMFVENSNSAGQQGGGGGGKRAREHELIPDLPLELQKKVMAQRAIAAAGGAGAGAGVAEGGMESGAETDRTTMTNRTNRTATATHAGVRKELVPLLGVPSDGARYVTKSTKVRYDGVMAEIASALREPEVVVPTPAS